MGADLRAALVASCLRGALPPVDLRAVCLVLLVDWINKGGGKERGLVLERVLAMNNKK